MKIHIEKDPTCNEMEIIIRYREIDTELPELISNMGTVGRKVAGEKDGETYFIPISDIYYFETVEEKTFFYTENNTYRCETKLYLIEESLNASYLARVSKSTIANLRKVRSIKKGKNARPIGTLINGEKIIISRFYVPDIREKMGV